MRRKLLAIWFASALSSCAVTVPNVKACRVAGAMGAGADCAWTLSSQRQEMSPREFVTFLEPTHYRGAAVCMPADHWADMKTALEQACHALGNKCRPEVDPKRFVPLVRPAAH